MSTPDAYRSEQVADYVSGRLHGEALERFELALFEDRALLESVEAEQALRKGYHSVAATTASATISRLPQKAAPRWTQGYLPMAASFLLGAILPGLLLWQMRATSLADGAVGNVQVAMVEATRGAPAAIVVKLQPGAPRIVLQFPVVHNEAAASYSLFLHGADFVDHQFEDLRADAEDMLSVELPTGGLASGTYTARIVVIGFDANRSDYLTQTFELRR